MNHLINIGVQRFLKTCKILGQGLEVENEDLMINEDDANAPTEEEQNEREAAACIAAAPEYTEEVAEAATHFQHTMYKLREIGKVCSCNTQRQPSLLVGRHMCITCW